MKAQIFSMPTAENDVPPNPDLLAASFDDFWRAYPRRVAKKDALKAWNHIKPTVYPKIFSALEHHRQSDDWSRDNGRFIPHAATWLNGERWEDELEGNGSLGECCWNRNGNREPGQSKCMRRAEVEKTGIGYCKAHGERVR